MVAALLLRFAIASVVGKTLNFVFAKLFPGGGPPNAHRPDTIEGYPRHCWLLSVFGQAVCMPGCWALAYFHSGAKFDGWDRVHTWCLLGAAELEASGCVWEGAYLVVLFAAQAKDMLPPPKTATTSLILHHWAIMIISFLAFFLTGAFNVFAFGSFVLELGTLWYNLHNLYPTSAALNVAYHVAMLASNIFGLVSSTWFIINRSDSSKGPQLWACAVYGVVAIGVIIGRQHHALRDYRASQGKAKAH